MVGKIGPLPQSLGGKPGDVCCQKLFLRQPAYLGLGLFYMHLNYKVYILVALSVLLSCPASANGWDASIEGSKLSPETIIAVDKKEQKTHVLVHRSPIRAELTFSCTTGKSEGDKLVEGDEKTPEGVYFISGKKTGLRDYELYGDMAFPLDFPNPVDKIKGKTGHGIWIHGRGKDLVSRDTHGCVALSNTDIGQLDKIIGPGSPVVIGKAVNWSESEEKQQTQAQKMKGRVLAWAGSWSEKSQDFFKFYDADRFNVAENLSFSSFKKHKEGIFDRTPWIDVEIFDLKALHGPDYWVTWFNQFYRSSNYVSVTNKRLYWQNVDGTWKIVGIEFGPRPAGLDKRYLERKRPGIEKFIEDWRKSWLAGDLDNYISFYDNSALQGDRRGLNAIREQKKSIWSEKSPAKVDFGAVDIKECPEGFRVSFRQEYEDSSGYKDTGLKVLVLSPEKNKWRIIKEQWSRLK